ncbi:restriction endonuclease subunit R [Halobacillus fulvus]|nr:restriction endonuclease subunit R [Halobacillus fulvus]
MVKLKQVPERLSGRLSTVPDRREDKEWTADVEARTWESTVNKLLSLRPQNRLIEFTATVNLLDDNIFDKYKQRIVFQYDLKEFMKKKYSKNVMLLRANEDDDKKMIRAALLSQYRKYVALDNGVDLKPIILFKSNKVAVSQEANRRFLQIIQNLTSDNLKNIIESGLNDHRDDLSIWFKAFSYLKQMSEHKVVSDLKFDFTVTTTPNMNDSSQSSMINEMNAAQLNTLEEPNNPIRAIFAVAKLNEGWDVLNLFDIVRVSEGMPTTKTATDSEAQLIGRGARYYPFVFDGERDDTRRFDDTAHPMSVIETLHYHTINESSYIKSLERSLREAEITVKEDKPEPVVAKVKDKFKRHPVYKNGKIFINKLVPTTVNDYLDLSQYDIAKSYEIKLSSDLEQRIDQLRTKVNGTGQRKEIEWIPGKNYIRKAIQRNPFFHFNNLKSYMPAIDRMSTFINDENFLGNLKIYLTIPDHLEVNDFSANDKLSFVEQFMNYAEKKIRNNYKKERGTPVFEGVSMPKLIDDYYLEIHKVNRNVDMTEIKSPRSMRDIDWFVYDKAIINNLESDMIDFVSNYMDKLKEKYNDVFLIRNERKIKIVEIEGVRGFMPDFLLYLKDNECTYQIFLEPKGGHLIQQDKWKEEFLLSLSKEKNVEVLSENENVRLLGVRFYSDSKEKKSVFREDFINKTLKED